MLIVDHYYVNTMAKAFFSLSPHTPFTSYYTSLSSKGESIVMEIKNQPNKKANQQTKNPNKQKYPTQSSGVSRAFEL